MTRAPATIRTRGGGNQQFVAISADERRSTGNGRVGAASESLLDGRRCSANRRGDKCGEGESELH
jgi:hypothetical protein